MSNNKYFDFTQFFSKNYNKPEHKEEKLFKQKCISFENLVQNILKTDIKKGLNMSDNDDIIWRKKVFGTNEYYSSSEENTFINFLSISFEDPIIIFTFILLILLIIIDIINEGIKEGYKEGVSILFFLLLYLSSNALKDYNSKNKIINNDKIKRTKKVKVIRNNKEEIISNRDILVGDILALNKGDIVEVDGFYTQEKKIGIDESPIIQGENKYKIKYKSKNFIFDKEKKEYICPFIFAGTYVVEGFGYMLVTSVGKNIYKNSKIIDEIKNEQLLKYSKYNEEEINESMGLEGDDDELEEYLNDYGYYKIMITALSEQISSIGIYFFFLLGFISIVKKSVIRLKEKKYFMSFEEADIIINGILTMLIGYIFSTINSLFMIDLIGFLSDEKRMKNNNIIFKYEKYSELAYIDILIILDNKRPLIPEDSNNYKTRDVIKKLKNLGIKIIFLSKNNIEDTIIKAKDLGIIDDMEIEKGKKILKACKNSVKKNPSVIKESPIILEGNIFYCLSGNIKKEIKKNGNEKIIFEKIDDFKKVINNLKVISNVRKEDKLVLINGLKQLKILTAITGNELEDLKLMKIANFSFGNNNDNNILKENYSLTLLDNSLNSFLKAYIYSTNLIYKIKNYLVFFISIFFTILIVNAIGIFLFRDLPINIIPIIFIIFIIDISAPSGIVEGNIGNKLLTKYKYSRNIPLINNKTLLDICMLVIINVIIIVYLMVKGDKLFNFESDELLEHNIWNDKNGYHITIIFCVLLFMILIHLVLIIIKNNNNYIKFGFNICILIMILVTIVNYGGKVTRTKPLNQNDLFKCFGIACFAIPVYFFF